MIEGVMNRSHWNRSRKSNMASPLCEGAFLYGDALSHETMARHACEAHLGLLTGPIRPTTTGFRIPLYPATNCEFLWENTATQQVFVIARCRRAPIRLG